MKKKESQFAVSLYCFCFALLVFSLVVRIKSSLVLLAFNYTHLCRIYRLSDETHALFDEAPERDGDGGA